MLVLSGGPRSGAESASAVPWDGGTQDPAGARSEPRVEWRLRRDLEHRRPSVGEGGSK